AALQAFQGGAGALVDRQPPALPGHRRRQGNGRHAALAVAPCLLPFDPAAAAVAAVADGEPAAEAPFGDAAQGCLARVLRRDVGGGGGGARRRRLAHGPAGAGRQQQRKQRDDERRRLPHAPVSSSARCSERLSGSSLRASSKYLRASSFSPSTHSTWPRWLAMSGSFCNA